MSSPSHVYWTGIDSPGSKAVLVSSKDIGAAPWSGAAVPVGSASAPQPLLKIDKIMINKRMFFIACTIIITAPDDKASANRDGSS
jgi:hypothetical protein